MPKLLTDAEKIKRLRVMCYDLIQLSALHPNLIEATTTMRVCRGVLAITDGSGTNGQT